MRNTPKHPKYICLIRIWDICRAFLLVQGLPGMSSCRLCGLLALLGLGFGVQDIGFRVWDLKV